MEPWLWEVCTALAAAVARPERASGKESLPPLPVDSQEKLPYEVSGPLELMQVAVR